MALAAPQIARRVTRASGPGLAAAGCMGAVLTLAADLVGQRLGPGFSVPVGIVTGVLGGGYLDLAALDRMAARPRVPVGLGHPNSRRPMSPARLAALLLAIAALVFAGCGSDDEPAADAPAPAAADGGAFPATVEHKFGTTTVEAEPERIAIVGLTEQDTVLALGYKPIATTEWYGEQPYAVWPWAQEALGDAKPTVLSVTDGFEFEKIAELAPDLIIGTNAGIEQEDYDKLSQIAPTIPGAKGSTAYFSRVGHSRSS